MPSAASRCALLVTMATAAHVVGASSAAAQHDGNRLAHLDELDPYWPDVHAPKLTTPMWIGPEDADAGVEAAIVLSIDDMSDPAKYEAFLQPIVERLKQVASNRGRAPMSIFTCNVKPDDPKQSEILERFLAEGVSLECHTTDHPCPLFRDGDIQKASMSVNSCVALLARIPGNTPSAFRMPCCDSLNTNSPRFYGDVARRWTDLVSSDGKHHYVLLRADSSVAMAFTSDDPSLPREWVQNPDGTERFLALLPRDNRFANYVTNYPYPYLIGNRIWELPFVVPTDWQAQHLRGPNQSRTLDDLEAALDLTVMKQGLFTLVFHPHGWIQQEQIVALIDHAVAKWGRKVRFLSVHDVVARLCGVAMGQTSRVLDLDDDGLMDVMDESEEAGSRGVGFRFESGDTRRWNADSRRWVTIKFPSVLGWHYTGDDEHDTDESNLCALFGVIHGDGRASVILKGEEGESWSGSFDGTRWIEEPGLLQMIDRDGSRRELSVDGQPLLTGILKRNEWAEMHSRVDAGAVLRDLDGDGCCELIVANELQNAIFRFDREAKAWRRSPFTLPCQSRIVCHEACRELFSKIEGAVGAEHGGIRFVDLDEDGDLDLVVSGFAHASFGGATVRRRESGIWLFQSLEQGFKTPINVVTAPLGGIASLPADERAKYLPCVTRDDASDDASWKDERGSNNGMWIKDRALWWVNEDTDRLAGHCDRRSCNELLAPAFPMGKEPPPRSPDASLHSLHLRPGFKAELVAAEPLVQDPIGIEWSADGKLWVIEMGDYPLGVEESGSASGPGGRVKFLEDVDGDGRYDRATVFLDHLPFPTSVLPWRDGVLITAAPDLIFAADRNGDGKADVKEVLFTGFGQGNPQHRVNGLRYGLDGWVYGANGDSDGAIHSTKTGEEVDIAGRDWRCDPDRGRLEAVTGCTQYGRDRDDFGNWFGGNNVVPAWHFVLEDRNLRRNSLAEYPEPRVQVPAIPGAQPVFPASITRARFNDFAFANHFTSACSPTIYRDELFGPHFSPSLFVCEPVHNLVHREVIERRGVTFQSHRAADESASEFLASSDSWFRPVQTRTGPDGALWVVDMYRDVIEHPEWIPEEAQKQLDLRAGADMGRIYRVLPVEREPRPFIKLDHMSNEQLVERLASPNGWTRDTAQRLLVERQATDVLPQLQERVVDAPRPLERLHALCTLVLLATRSDSSANPLPLIEPPLLQAAHDVDPNVRIWALRWAKAMSVNSVGSRLAAAMFDWNLLNERDAAVLLQALSSYGDCDAQSAKVGTIAFYRALARLDDATDLDGRFLRAAAWSSVTKGTVGWLVDDALAQLSGSGGRLIARLAAIAAQTKDSASIRKIHDALAVGEQTPARWQIETARALLDVAEHGAIPLPLQPLLRAARIVAEDDTKELSLRVECVALTGRDGQGRARDVELLSRLLDPAMPPELAQAAAARLGAIDDDSVPARMLAAWKSASPELRRALLELLVRKDEWLPQLLDAIERKVVAANDLDAALRQRLVRHDDEAIRTRAAKLLAVHIDPDRQKVIERFRPALTLKGDRGRGQSLFETKCATCHQLNGLGHAVGPDLRAIADQSPESQLTSILDPNRAVESRYVSYNAFTKDGDTLVGILVEETSTSVTLRDSGGKEQLILRRDLKQLRSSTKSLMPDGLETDLQPKDFADLLAFVRADVLPGKRFPGNAPAIVRCAGECAQLELTAANAEIYGPTLVFEDHYKNLGYWQSADDRAVWTIDVARAGEYDVVADFACDPNNSGNTLVVEIAGAKLSFQVPSTNSWDEYRTARLGALALAAGEQRVTARADVAPNGALLDLRSLKFVLKQ